MLIQIKKKDLLFILILISDISYYIYYVTKKQKEDLCHTSLVMKMKPRKRLKLHIDQELRKGK